MTILTRRSILVGIIAAPIVIKASSLMALRGTPMRVRDWVCWYDIGKDGFRVTNMSAENAELANRRTFWALQDAQKKELDRMFKSSVRKAELLSTDKSDYMVEFAIPPNRLRDFDKSGELLYGVNRFMV